jgi:hypothetical protein
MFNRIRQEPALAVAFVLAIIGVATSFGLGITDGQSDAVVALVGAALAIIGGGVTRSQVTPAGLVVAKRVPETGGVVAGPGASAPTGEPVVVTSGLDNIEPDTGGEI